MPNQRRCPVCKTALGEDPARVRWHPFCSERCRTIDLGAWLDGTHRFSRPVSEEDLDHGLTLDAEDDGQPR